MTSQTTIIPASFSTIPAELRNNIYHHFFESIFHDQYLTSDAVCRRVESLKPALALLATSRGVRHEAAPIFWRDHVLRCHWGFGATCDDDARMASFANAARKHTLDVDITFQKRHLDTSSLGTNVAWLALLSTFSVTGYFSVSYSAIVSASSLRGCGRQMWGPGRERLSQDGG